MTLHQYQTARKTKDRTFDGQFFFAVKTTGIFCRPSCPSPVAKEENVEYYDTAFDAMDAGFRPCLRCRPDVEVDYYNGNIDGASIVNSALEKIYDGYLNDHSLSDLADELYLSDRHLRQLFVENIGLPPVKVAKYHKSIFAKKLLLYSGMSVTDIAFASGFKSIRQFNDVFKDLFGVTPSQYRKKSISDASDQSLMTLQIPYDQPFDYDQILAFMKPRCIIGVEFVENKTYSRTFRVGDTKGYFTLENNLSKSALELKIYSDDVRCYMTIYNKVRHMFDIDCNMKAITEHLSKDPLLAQGMPDGQVPRLPMAFNTFEFMIRAILGQQITVKAATTLAERLAEKAGIQTGPDYPDGLYYFFPNLEEMLSLDLTGIGITKTRLATIERVVKSLSEGAFNLDRNQTFENFYSDFTAIKGIGDWTANYIAMRGLGMADSFPASDLGIIKALMDENKKPSVREIQKRSEVWQPYRAYAALCLWNYASQKENN